MSSLPRRALEGVTTLAVTTAALVLLPASMSWAAAANTPPGTPSSLAVAGVGCAPDGILVGSDSPSITASFADDDFGTGAAETLTPEFAIWPAGEPANRTEWTAPALHLAGTVFTSSPATLVNGGRYDLTARATDAAGAASDWAPVCTFTVDTTPPHAPVVSSSDYPLEKASGGVGIPGKFTFAVAGGDTDVAQFRYSINGTGLADVPVGADGQATVEITPSKYGYNTLLVEAVDRTGNHSSEVSYEFSVLDRAPKVLDMNPQAGVGEPREIWLWSSVPDTVSFTYRLNDGPATTVEAAADGWTTVVVTPDRVGDNILSVTSQTTSGEVSPEVRRVLHVAAAVG